MPRGVYDRSKMKKNKGAHKSTETVAHTTHAAPTAHKKPGPKGPRGRKAKGQGANITQSISAGDRAGGQAMFLLSQARENLNTLTALKAQFNDIPAIRTEVEAHLEVFSDLRQELFPKRAAETQTTQATASNNGTTAQPQFQQTVPMPPSVPVIPTTH